MQICKVYTQIDILYGIPIYIGCCAYKERVSERDANFMQTAQRGSVGKLLASCIN